MGPKPSTPVENTPSIKINHPMFSVFQIVRGNKQDNQVIVTQVRLANRKQFDSWSKRVSQVYDNESIMFPLDKKYTEEGICGSSGIAHLTYQNFPYLLRDEITNRFQINHRLFEENQLWYLTFTLLSAALTYHQKGVKVGDIRPENIFINEQGQVKVTSIDSWPGQQTNYSKSFFEKQITYLSPEQIKDYQFGKIQESVDKQLAQTFSIGLTCLDAATLSSSRQFYSPNFKFNYQKLQTRLQQFQSYGYSQLLILTIQNMCQVDTEYRTSSQEIFNWLLPHQQAIINLQNFVVTGLPEKMRLARQRNNALTQQSTHPRPTTQLQNTTFNPPSVHFNHYPPSEVMYSQPSKIGSQHQQIVSQPLTEYNFTSINQSNLNTYQPSQVPFNEYKLPSSISTHTSALQSQPIINPLTYLQHNSGFNFQNTVSNTNVTNNNDSKSILERIDQQLAESRRQYQS